MVGVIASKDSEGVIASKDSEALVDAPIDVLPNKITLLSVHCV